jgi:hypothetical protein
MAFPDRIPKIRNNNSQRHALVPGHHDKKKIAGM